MQAHTVAYDAGHSLDQLEKKLFLEDAISDLPEVSRMFPLDFLLPLIYEVS